MELEDVNSNKTPIATDGKNKVASTCDSGAGGKQESGSTTDKVYHNDTREDQPFSGRKLHLGLYLMIIIVGVIAFIGLIIGALVLTELRHHHYQESLPDEVSPTTMQGTS